MPRKQAASARTKGRANLIEDLRSSVDRVASDQRDHDHNTTVGEYNRHKFRIRQHLCAHGDPFAIVVACGHHRNETATHATGRRIRELQNDGETVKLLRGYRLTTICDFEAGGQITYHADSTLVIRRENGQHECLARNRYVEDRSRFIFVPSSRMHADLSDAQLVSGAYLLCTIVDGPLPMLQSLLLTRDILSHFERRKICASPEDATSRRLLFTRCFPFLNHWFQTACKLPPDLKTDAAVSFGCCYRELSDDECAAALEDKLAGKELNMGPPVEPIALLEPEAPWCFEERVHLPTVEKLHAFYRCTVLSGTVWYPDQQSAYYKFYDALQQEYSDRLVSSSGLCGATMPPTLTGVPVCTETFK
jgi:hypothetical protein